MVGIVCFMCTCSCSLIIYIAELSSDPTICSHLATLYDTLLEQNLLHIVEPYLIGEIEYVVQQVGQGRQAVEAKCVPLLAVHPYLI